MEDQMSKFERIIIYWHSLGPHLERTICSVVRTVVGAVSGYYGINFTAAANNSMDKIPAFGGPSGGLMTPNMSPLTTLTPMPKSPLNRPQSSWNGGGQWQKNALVGHRRGTVISGFFCEPNNVLQPTNLKYYLSHHGLVGWTSFQMLTLLYNVLVQMVATLQQSCQTTRWGNMQQMNACCPRD